MLTVATNLKGAASTQYLDYNWNSMAMFQGVALGASETGIYKICCDDEDNGEPISAHFVLHTTDLGISNRKRMRFIYLGLECTGELLITVQADDGDIKQYQVFPVGTGQQTICIPINRDQMGRYWSVKIGNVDGSDFSVDSIKIQPIILAAGRNY